MSQTPFRTGGKKIWWVPDRFSVLSGWYPDATQILYRDEKRDGVWVPEERISAEWVEKLEEAVE